MSHRIAYYRVSTGDQSVEAQKAAMQGTQPFDQEFADHGISGATMAATRPQFAKLLEQVRSGDTVCVYAIDRLGRDALDVQATVRSLIERGVTVDVHGIGPIAKGVGEIILAVLAQIADMERNRIRERTESGRRAARQSLEQTGKTHKGKHGLGRKPVDSAAQIAGWRAENNASIATTAQHFKVSPATVKRYCAEATKRQLDLQKDHDKSEASLRRQNVMERLAESERLVRELPW